MVDINDPILMAQDDAALDCLARGLMVPLRDVLDALSAEWPEFGDMPERLQEPANRAIDAALAIVYHPAWERMLQRADANNGHR